MTPTWPTTVLRRKHSRHRLRAVAALAGGAALFALTACGSSSGGSPAGGTTDTGGAGTSGTGSSGSKVGVSLILKTLSNPYFVSMQKDAETAAAQDNVNLTVAAGKQDGDTQTQISAIEDAIARGDKGILITTNGDAVNAALQRARQAGIYVIALDTAPNPPSVADITYATDNEAAGKLDGTYAAKQLNGQKATIAMLDLFNDQVVSVDVQRDHGFLEGMGIDPGSTTQNGKEAQSGNYKGLAGGSGQYQIACHQPTEGAVDGGRTAMETCLSANPDINVVYTINEPAAEGAYAALQAAGKQNDVKIYTIDGSCDGLKYVDSGEFTADAVQYPGKMASLGVASIAKLANGGAKPKTSNGLDFFNTGTALATNKPLPGIESETSAQAEKECWG